MKIAVKIIATLIVIATVGYYVLLSIVINVSSHNIEHEMRVKAKQEGDYSIILGLLVIVIIWLPWNSLVRRLKPRKQIGLTPKRS